MGDETVKKVWDEVSHFYDKFRTSGYFKKVLAFLQKTIPKGSSILDVGGGTGKFCVELAKKGYNIKGFDYSTEMVKKAIKNIKKNKVTCVYKLDDAEEEIPFKENFDFAISIDSWEFFPHPLKVLKNVHSKLKKGGVFIIITPNPYIAPLIILAEKSGIKKVYPTYIYFNSFHHRIKLFAKATNFKLEKKDWMYHFFAQVFFLRKLF